MSELTPELMAAYEFVELMVPRSDDRKVMGAVQGFSRHGDATFGPWWHGWALREAFLAGYKQAQTDRRWKRFKPGTLPCDRCGKPGEWLDKNTMNEVVYCSECGGPK